MCLFSRTVQTAVTIFGSESVTHFLVCSLLYSYEYLERRLRTFLAAIFFSPRGKPRRPPPPPAIFCVVDPALLPYPGVPHTRHCPGGRYIRPLLAFAPQPRFICVCYEGAVACVCQDGDRFERTCVIKPRKQPFNRDVPTHRTNVSGVYTTVRLFGPHRTTREDGTISSTRIGAAAVLRTF